MESALALVMLKRGSGLPWLYPVHRRRQVSLALIKKTTRADEEELPGTKPERGPIETPSRSWSKKITWGLLTISDRPKEVCKSVTSDDRVKGVSDWLSPFSNSERR